MRERGLAALVDLVREGLAIEIGFGSHSLEALLWVAETVEGSVYTPGSLVRTERGLAFSLSNPPLRMGAFHALRAFVGGAPVAASSVSVREGPGRPWRSAASLSEAEPLAIRPGQSTEIALEPWTDPGPGRLTVRLELESVAIPPLVWVEFADEVRTPESVR
jgi:hypothetical protein